MLLRSLLRQLCGRSNIPPAIQTLYETCDQGLDRRPPTVGELAKVLGEMVASTAAQTATDATRKQHYLLIDGLDELTLSSQESLYETLRPVLAGENPDIHVILSSRSQREIERSLDNFDDRVSLVIEVNDVQGDIRTFVLSEIDSYSPLRRLPQTTHNAILSRVAEQSNGMYGDPCIYV